MQDNTMHISSRCRARLRSRTQPAQSTKRWLLSSVRESHHTFSQPSRRPSGGDRSLRPSGQAHVGFLFGQKAIEQTGKMLFSITRVAYHGGPWPVLVTIDIPFMVCSGLITL